MSLWKIGRKRSKESVFKQIETRNKKYGNNQPGNFKKGEHRSRTTEFKVGSVPHNKGKTHLQKEKHPMWKGGVTSENTILRNSAKNQIWRNTCFIRDKFTCQDCGKRGGNLHVHHIKEWSKFPKLRFNLDNGVTLCQKCHIRRHNGKWIPIIRQKS